MSSSIHCDHAEEMPPRYVYRALSFQQQEIRLLDVYPGTNEEPLKCSLRQVCLRASQSQYETISYCWGDASLCGRIYVNDRSLDVPESAINVLQRMRHHDRVRTLWIDAVCIDQSDLQERSEQVSLMGTIYSSSAGNLIWLGPSGDYGTAVYDSIRLIVGGMDAINLGFDSSPDDIYDFMAAIAGSSRLRDLEVDYTALVCLYSLPWFSRVWVFQEAFLAPKNTCFFGPWVMSLSDILVAASWVGRQSNSLEKSSGSSDFEQSIRCTLALYNALKRREMNGFEGLTIMDMYGLADMRKATDPRDRIFGMLGMCKPLILGACAWLLQPDYTKSVAEFFRDATRAFIQFGSDFRLLEYASWQTEGMTSVEVTRGPQPPSWAVKSLAQIWKDPLELPPQFMADSGRLAICTFDRNDLDLISVRGVMLGTIERLTETVTPVTEVCGFLKQCEELLTGSHHAEHYQRRLEELSCTLIAGSGQVALAHDQDHFKFYQVLKNRIDNHNSCKTDTFIISDLVAKTGLQAPSVELTSERYAKAFSAAVKYRRFFVLGDGRMGLGPEGLQAHDNIAVLYGARVPFAFRQCGTYSKILGPCYLHGVMDGEAVRELEQKGMEPDTIMIK